MFRSLVWKEWHEQRWRLWFGVFLVGMFTLIGLRTRIMPDEQIVILTIMIGGMGLPLMVAMGLVAPERAEGTIVRLMALPVPPWKVVAAKGLVGGLVCVAPIFVSAVIALLMAGDRELSWGELLGLYAMALGVTLVMFSWLTAVAIRQPSEARAALVGIAAVVAWSLLIAIAEMLRTEVMNISDLEQWVGACSPFGFIIIKEDDVPRLAVLGLQLLSIALLWTWSARRIGKSGKVVA
jgi:ABC-type transport system involved in multi-copper enzyme maturation permease subunit